MRTLIDDLFMRLRSDIERNLAAQVHGSLADGADRPRLATGEKSFDFQTDVAGAYTLTQSQYGGGVTLTCTASISLPYVPFSLRVTSSDGGGGSWTNIQPGKALTFKVKTSLWHKTTLGIAYKSAAISAVGKGTIKYSY